MKCVYLTEEEIEVINDALDSVAFEYGWTDVPMDENGVYYDDDCPEDAKRANAIASIREKL
ncbi:hypothetical protein ACWCL1_04975 [Ligilactobacillus sp. LYQ135]